MVVDNSQRDVLNNATAIVLSYAVGRRSELSHLARNCRMDDTVTVVTLHPYV